MEQRPLRLGDIVDDYCPRERRVTNHAVVAMIEDTIKQTRCATCDSDHVYKGGQAPRRKKSDSTSRLYKEVLSNLTESEKPSEHLREPEPAVAPMPALAIEGLPAMVVALDGAAAVATVAPRAAEVMVDRADDVAAVALASAAISEEADLPADEMRGYADEGPVHRPLIRATLPRPDGVKVERPIPDFTVRHGNGNGHGNGSGNGRGQGNGSSSFRDMRGGGARPRGNGAGSGNGSSNGQRFGRGPQGSGSNGRGGGRGAVVGFGSRPPGNRPSGPRKRSR